MPALTPQIIRVLFNLEPKAAVAYLQRKGFKLTWNWQEQLDEAHARAFTVAKVARLDVLQDIRAALDESLKKGLTFQDFQKNLTPTLQAKGWWGKQIIVDSQGGAEVAKLGSPWRLNTIYRTNLQSAFMAGRYQAMADGADSHPYWQYVAIMDGRTRPSHAAMNGRVFKVDDPIWNTAYPPNGFNCRCRVRPVSAPTLKREGLAWQSSEGKRRTITVDAGVDKRTGEVAQARRTGIDIPGPNGQPVFFAPDAGFNFNAGKAWAAPFTPPPLDTLPMTFAAGQMLPDLPKPESFDPSKLLPSGLAPEDYVSKFLGEFDAAIGRPAIYMDKTGEPLTINEELFRDHKGGWKVTKRGREQYLPMLAEAIKNPDEIWMYWVGQTGHWRLHRRYIKVFEVEGEAKPGLAVFEEGTDGWTGETIFQVDQRTPDLAKRYINQKRGGFLAYRRKDSP